MLSFLRRIVNSRLGVVVTLGFVALVALAFGLGDVLGNASGGVAGGDVANVGGKDVTARDLRQHADAVFRRTQGQQPGATLAGFVAQGGVEATLNEIIQGLALEAFGNKQGVVVSKRSEDGQIASLPQLQDAAGHFDQTAYERLLKSVGITDAQLREDVRQDIMAQRLLAPTLAANQVPVGMAVPYASLLLEQRQGTIGFIPTTAAAGGPAPGAAEVQAFYQSHRDQYLIPERRAARYALVTPDLLKGRVTPSEAEIAQAYAQGRDQFQPTQKRSLIQVTVLDPKAAADLAAKVKGGTDLAAAARTAGLEPNTLAGLTRTALAAQSSPAVADAAFAAAQGSVIGPVRGPLGFIVGKVTAVEQVPGKTLDQARPQLVEAVTKDKTTRLLAQMRNQAEDALGAKANFSEVASRLHLTVAATPALTSAAVDPDHSGVKPDPALVPVIGAAFQAEQGDPPSLAPIGQDGGFALVTLDRVVAAAPPPLAKIQDLVTKDVTAQRAKQAARQIAAQVLAKVNAGTPLAQALAGAGHALPPPRPIGGVRGELLSGGKPVPPPIAFLFSMTPGATRVLDAPNDSGWYVIHLDKAVAGDARRNAALVSRITAEFARLAGREYAEQFSRAAQKTVGVKRDDAAIARIKADLTGQGGSNQ
jgi:peptidyl-prolyl cis-trans isomerase D